MKRALNNWYGWMGIVAVLACGASAAVQPAVLVDRQLARQPIQLVSLIDGRLTYFDANRRLKFGDAAEYVVMRLIHPIEPPADVPLADNEKEPLFDEATDPSLIARPQSASAETDANESGGNLLHLTDGTVLRGSLAGVDAEGRLEWQTQWFGRIAIQIDQVVGFDHAPVDPSAAALPQQLAAAEDHILLTNGDRLSGFVEAINSQGLVLQLNNTSVTLAWDRVASVKLANVMQRRSGVWITLVDQTQAVVEKLRIESNQVGGSVLDGRDLDLPTAALAAIDFSTRHRLVPIGLLDAEVTGGGIVFGVSMPPRFDAETAELHAPLQLRFTLPAGAVRFAADAWLDPLGLDWADLIVRIADGRGELWSAHLGAEKPSAQINVAPRDRTLIIELDPAANGPIRDRLTLYDAVLLVEYER